MPGNEQRTPSQLIDARIAALPDWQGEVLTRIRRLILEADPDVVEDVKWRKPSNAMLGVPVWSHDGLICTGEPYKDKVKLTFAKGAFLPDPAGLFNAGFGGGTRRAIDVFDGDDIDETAFVSLVRAAVARNEAGAEPDGPGDAPGRASASHHGDPPAAPKLLSGGNPQIPKADGDAPVQAYIAAMPGWKRDVGRRLDALVVRTVPDVRKAVRWNSPFYGIEDQGWFLSLHCYTRYVKVAFLNGASLDPPPPAESKHDEVRYLHIHEDDRLDEAQLASWLAQAAGLPGAPLF